MLTELKRQHIGVEGDMSRVQKLILERDVELQRIDYRQPEHLVSKQKREIKSTYADKMFAEASNAKQRGEAAEEALQRLTPEALEEAADFSSGADESAPLHRRFHGCIRSLSDRLFP